MLNVLLESRAVRTRRVGGTLASMLVHGAAVAAAVTLTVRQTPGIASTPAARPTITYVPVPDVPPSPPRMTRPPRPTQSPVSSTVAPRPIVHFVPPNVPRIDAPVTSIGGPDDILPGPGLPTAGPFAASPGVSGPTNGVIEERYVDRAPRMLGSPVHPSFPSSLRDRGRDGRVVIQFVVDTLGRAEMNGLRVVEATDPLFVASVRAVLPRYRFSPGEAGGRRVRTLVQLPFEFSLVR